MPKRAHESGETPASPKDSQVCGARKWLLSEVGGSDDTLKDQLKRARVRRAATEVNQIAVGCNAHSRA